MPHVAGHMDVEESTSYSDFEVQHAVVNLDNDGSANSEAETVWEAEPVSGDLDNDEVAELVKIYRTFFARVSQRDEQQTQTGFLAVEYGIALNTPNRDQFLVNKSGDNEGRISVVDEEGGAAIADQAASELDEPEQLDYHIDAACPTLNDTSGNVGGGGDIAIRNERTINLRDSYGTGPFVDRTDAVNLFMEVTKNNILAPCRGQIHMTLVWDVARIQDSRAKLAPPRAD